MSEGKLNVILCFLMRWTRISTLKILKLRRLKNMNKLLLLLTKLLLMLTRRTQYKNGLLFYRRGEDYANDLIFQIRIFSWKRRKINIVSLNTIIFFSLLFISSLIIIEIIIIIIIYGEQEHFIILHGKIVWICIF